MADRSAVGSRRTKFHLTILMAVLAAALSILIFGPGYTNGDSIGQLTQARSGNYSNWHPTALSWIWGKIDRVIPGPAGMHIFNQVFFWGGIGPFLYHALGNLRSTAGVALLFFFNLPLAFAFTQIGKDSTLVATLVFSVGMLMHAERARSKIALLLAVIAMTFSYWVRHNSFAALIPIIFWATGIFVDQFLRSEWRPYLAVPRRRLAATAVAIALMTGSHWAFEKWVTRTSDGFISQAVMTFDLTGISVETRRNHLPRLFDTGLPLTLRELDRLYNPLDCTRLLWLVGTSRGPGFIYKRQDLQVLFESWVTAILKEPAAYLRHRTRLFMGLLNLGIPQHWPYWLPSPEQTAREQTWNSGLRAGLFRQVLELRNTPVLKAYSYVFGILAFMILGTVLELRDSRAFWALGWSAVFYELAYFPMGTNAGFRCSWWPMAAFWLLVVLMRWDLASWSKARARLFNKLSRPSRS